uniref:Uncharacterized protein n=1 Tax=Esox lucius TaxID=8010 RepID=A0A3P8YIA8_ESOLU
MLSFNSLVSSAAASQLPTDQPQQKQPPLQQTAKPQPPVSEGSSLFTEEFGDDSQFESVFNEQTCRRNLRVSRSGRFKERKKVRSSLPTDDQDQEEAVVPTNKLNIAAIRPYFC